MGAADAAGCGELTGLSWAVCWVRSWAGVCVCVALWERERMNDEVDGESTRRRREAEKSCVVVWIGEPERVIDCRDTSSGSSGNF